MKSPLASNTSTAAPWTAPCVEASVTVPVIWPPCWRAALMLEVVEPAVTETGTAAVSDDLSL
jgi:hypothetical protein